MDWLLVGITVVIVLILVVGTVMDLIDDLYLGGRWAGLPAQAYTVIAGWLAVVGPALVDWFKRRGAKGDEHHEHAHTHKGKR